METNTHHHAPCESCIHFQAQENSIGTCHRFPPIFTGDSAAIDFHHWKFPLVSGHSWCGEFQAATAW